jgi:hypothetical protein
MHLILRLGWIVIFSTLMMLLPIPVLQFALSLLTLTNVGMFFFSPDDYVHGGS